MAMRVDAGDGDVVAAYPFRWRADEARRCLRCPRDLTGLYGMGGVMQSFAMQRNQMKKPV